MKKTFSYLILFIGLSLAGTPVLAQLDFIGFHFKSSKRKKVSFNFELYNNLMVLQMAVNHLDTLNFVIDTGVGYTLITDPEVMKQLNLICYRQIKVTGAGGVEDGLQGYITNVKSMSFGGIQTINHNLIVLERDVLHLSRYAGIKIHGLIGYDLFSRFVVKIDYLSKKITFYDPKHFSYKGKGERFPLSIEEMKPYVQAEAILSSGNIPVKLIIDTGAGHSLSLEQGAHPSIQIPNQNIPSNLGMTLSGMIQGAIGRIKKFKIGSYEMKKVITSFPDSSSLKHVKGSSNRQGNIGLGVLRRFMLILNYPHNEVILRPNRSFKEPFEFNTSGIDLIADTPDYKTIKVGSVRKNSPADDVGIKEGDEVISIDNYMTNDLNMNEVYKILNKKEGKKTLLLIRRKGSFFMKEIKLKQPI
jgi:hypothetical protein